MTIQVRLPIIFVITLNTIFWTNVSYAQFIETWCTKEQREYSKTKPMGPVLMPTGIVTMASAVVVGVVKDNRGEQPNSTVPIIAGVVGYITTNIGSANSCGFDAKEENKTPIPKLTYKDRERHNRLTYITAGTNVAVSTILFLKAREPGAKTISGLSILTPFLFTYIHRDLFKTHRENDSLESVGVVPILDAVNKTSLLALTYSW